MNEYLQEYILLKNNYDAQNGDSASILALYQFADRLAAAVCKLKIFKMISMCFWWFIFCCDLLVPALMIAGGRIMWKHPPKNINGLIGYRTSRSMKNMDTWIFAQDYCGKLWWKVGWITLVPSIFVHIPFYGVSNDVIGNVGLILFTVQIIILICSIFPTENALKKSFTDEGIRR